MSSSAVVIESAGPRSSSTGIISGGARHRSSTQALIAYKNQPGYVCIRVWTDIKLCQRVEVFSSDRMYPACRHCICLSPFTQT